MADAPDVLAIDFGTCYSSAARMIDGRPEPVKDPLKHIASIPSTVVRTRDGELVVGWLAENQKRSRAGDYAEEFKRVLGRQPVVLGDTEVPAEDLVTEVLRFIKEEAEKTDGEYERAVVTVPASYEAKRRKLMVEAAKAAGFTDVELLHEPVAAAMARKRRGTEDELILVYDLGGGTFDAALVELSEGRYEVLDSDGIDKIGGANFDRAIESDLAAQAGDVLKEALKGLKRKERDDEWVRAKRQELNAREFCEDQIKKQLSRSEHVENELILEGASVPYELSQHRLEEMIDAELKATVECCERLIEKCDRSWDDVTGILMVGGSCRLPFIGARLERETGRPIEPVLDPELAVCLGAALHVQHVEEQERERERREEEERRKAEEDEKRRKREKEKAEKAKRQREAKRSAAALKGANEKRLRRMPEWPSFPAIVHETLIGMLEPDEVVELTAKCMRSQDWMRNTALVATSKRIIWARSGAWAGLQSGAFPLKGLTVTVDEQFPANPKLIVGGQGFSSFNDSSVPNRFASFIRERQGALEPRGAEDPGAGDESTSIDDLDISIRARNGLRAAGITTAAEIAAKSETELAALPSFGIRLAREVLAAAESVVGEAESEVPEEPAAEQDGAAARRSRLAANRKRLAAETAWGKASDAVRGPLMKEVGAGEDVLEVASCVRSGSSGILIVTSERVLWATEDAAPASVALEDVETVKRPADKSIVLHHGGEKELFSSVSRPAKVVKALRDARPEAVAAG